MFLLFFISIQKTKGAPPPPLPPNCTTCLNNPNEHFGKKIFLVLPQTYFSTNARKFKTYST